MKPCPKCGENKLIGVFGSAQTGSMEYWVECKKCGAHTGKYLLKNRAEREWNHRNVRYGLQNDE